MVRVFLATNHQTPSNIRGELEIRRGFRTITLGSVNQITVVQNQNGQLDDKRNRIEASLNFIIPHPYHESGDIEVSLIGAYDAMTGVPIMINTPTQTRRISFVQCPPLRLAIIGLRYHSGDPAVTFTPRNVDVQLLVSWLQRVYPTAEVDYTYRIVDANFQWPFTATQINTQLAAIRNQDVEGGVDPRTHYYGMVFDGNVGQFMRGRASGIPNVPDPSIVASGPTGAGTQGWDLDGSYGDWYGGHELAHTFGRFHPGFCNNNSKDDLNYPYPGGSISLTINSFVGLDVGDASLGIAMRALPGQVWSDVMTYCNNQWMSDYTYTGILQRLIAEDELISGNVIDSRLFEEQGVSSINNLELTQPSPSEPEKTRLIFDKGDLINVVCNVNLSTMTGKIQFVNPLPIGLHPREEIESNVSLRFINAEGTYISTVPVEVKLDSCREMGEGKQGIVDVVLEKPPQSVAVELLIDGRVVNSFGQSRTITSAENIRAIRSFGIKNQLATVGWDSAEAEDPNVTYTVQISTNDGTTWQTYSIGSKNPEVTIDKSQFAEDKKIRMRVITTNGFTSSSVEIDSLDLDNFSSGGNK